MDTYIVYPRFYIDSDTVCVELEKGGYGFLRNVGFKKIHFDDKMEVFFTGYNPDGYPLFSVAKNANGTNDNVAKANPAKANPEIKKWGNGEFFGHRNAVLMLDELLKKRFEYIDSVNKIESKRTNEKKKSQADRDRDIGSFSSEISRIENEKKNNIQKIEERKNNKLNERNAKFASDERSLLRKVDEIKKKKAIVSELKKYPEYDTQKAGEAKDEFQIAIDEIKKDIEKARQEKRTDVNKVITDYDKQIKRTKDDAQRKINEIDEKRKKREKKYNDECSAIENEYTNSIKKLNGEYDRLIKDNFSDAVFDKYRSVLKQYVISGDSFICPKEISKYLYFGNIHVNIEKTSQTSKGLDGILTSYAAGECEENNGHNELIIKFPYLQKIDDGLSLIIKHNGGGNVREYLKYMVLKVLMSYPAGKLITTMIDPHGAGNSFTGLTRLGGDNNVMLRDTKIWSEKDEIENAIERLRETVVNRIQVYGKDRESLVQKEQLRMLVINDFPENFTNKSLDGLRTILRNCNETGTIVYIMSTVKDFSEFIDKVPNFADDIKKCIRLEQCGNENDFRVENTNNYHISIRNISSIKNNIDKIVNEISKSALDYQYPIVSYSDLYAVNMLEPQNWFRGETKCYSSPIGFHSHNDPLFLKFGAVNDTNQNILIEGSVRSGKTNLLHSIILGGLLNYKPEYLQFYLIDFKDGNGFIEYTNYRLPSMRVIAVDTEKEFALNILQELNDEMTRRNDEFARFAHSIGENIIDIETYNKKVEPSKIMPRLLLIFDELSTLFDSDSQSSNAIPTDCLHCIRELQKKGGNVGIHMILATQDFKQCKGVNVDTDFSQARIRMVTFGKDDTTCSILQSTEGMVSGRLGSALFNDNSGKRENNRYLQVGIAQKGIIPKEKPCRQDYQSKLDWYYKKLSSKYSSYETRIWSKNVEKDPYLYFNQIRSCYGNSAALKDIRICSEAQIGVLLGNGIKNHYLTNVFSHNDKDNMLIIGESPTKANKKILSIEILLILSIMCESAIKNINSHVYVIDGEVRRGDATNDAEKVKLKNLSEIFNNIDYESGRNEDFINIMQMISNIVDNRIDGNDEESSIYLIIHHIDDMQMFFERPDIYDSETEAKEYLMNIIKNGPKVGVYTILSASYYDSIVSHILIENDTKKDLINLCFGKRIAIDFKDSDKQYRLVNEREISSGIGNNIAIIYDSYSNVAEIEKFLVYDIPETKWTEEIADSIYDGQN